METATEQLRVTRTFRASPERAFAAWTEPEQMMQWFVEGDTRMTLCEIDLREGGRYRFEGDVAGKRWAVWGAYREVRRPERLVYTWSWEHDPGLGDPTGDTLVTVEFRRDGDGTELVLTHERFASAQARSDHAGGWDTCMRGLARLLD